MNYPDLDPVPDDWHLGMLAACLWGAVIWLLIFLGIAWLL